MTSYVRNIAAADATGNYRGAIQELSAPKDVTLVKWNATTQSVVWLGGRV